MGNVKSCCKDTISEADDHEERSRILNGDNCWASNSSNSALSNQDSVSYGSINNGNGSNNGNSGRMEQSALDKIYQKMASSVIDVAPGESMVIQQAEFLERQRAYQAKLNQIKVPLPLKLIERVTKHSENSNQSFDTTLNDSTMGNQEKRRVEYEPISADDIQLINEISQKSAQGIASFRISSREKVVAQFKP